jgi:hypothetical protein
MSFCQVEKKPTAVLVSHRNKIREMLRISASFLNFADGTHGAWRSAMIEVGFATQQNVGGEAPVATVRLT